MTQGQPPTDSGRTASATRTATRGTDSSGWITGRVIEGDDTPIVGATVSVLGAPDSVLTGADGRFALPRVPLGAHMVKVQRLGFAAKRFALTIAADVRPDVTVTMTRFVPVLPTVTTTAEERMGYHSVGFDRRMQAGIGQFLTYDQIVAKHATTFTQLLQGLRGIQMYEGPMETSPNGATVAGTRGIGSCVAYVVDGVPQQQLMETDALGTPLGAESPDNLVQESEIGAIEVYSPSERPAEFGAMEEHAQDPRNTLDRNTFLRDQPCSLVMIWTRAKLGIDASTSRPSAGSAPPTANQVTRGFTTLMADSACKAPSPIDTAGLLIYATVQGERPNAISDSAWEDYKYHVLSAIDRWGELPSELLLPSFSLPTSRQASSGVPSGNGHDDEEVAPSLSTVLAVTLDRTGAITGIRVAASSMSADADTSVLAMVEAAAQAHAFPPAPPGINSVQLYLVVESAEPAVATRAAVLGELAVPVWRLARPARLTRGAFPGGLIADSTAVERITVMMAVDATGHVVEGTTRLETGPAMPAPAAAESEAAVLKTLPDVRFDPALIGTCRVNEFVVESFTPPKAEPR